MTHDDSDHPGHPAMAGAQLRLSALPYADSHGAADGRLGAGYLYYAMAASTAARICVCLGSGAGFVPALMAQAQRDLGIAGARTILVDAVLPEKGWGSPLVPGGWLDNANPILSESGIELRRLTTAEAAASMTAKGMLIDYLHIDADRSEAGVLADFMAYAPIVAPGGVVSLHDLHLPGVRAAIATIRARHPQWEYLAFPELGAGSAFLRRSVPRPRPAWAGHAAELPGRTGRIMGPARIAEPGRDLAGHLAFGPFLPVPPGAYQVSFTYASPAPFWRVIGHWDVCNVGGDVILARGTLRGTHGHLRPLRAQALVPRADRDATLEVRIHYQATGAMRLERVAIAPA